MNGGILVNADGERFGNESKGYSEFAVDVVRQPDGVAAYEIFDERIFERLQGEFDDFDRAVELGSYTSADTVEELAAELGCAPEATRDAVESYNAAVDAGEPDEVGRADGRNVLSPRSTGPRSPARCSTRRAGWSSTNTRGCSGRTGRPSTGSTPGWHRDGHQRSRGRRLPLRERAHDRHGARPARRRSARRPVAG